MSVGTKNHQYQRVVVTGLGPVSPIGIGKTALFDALRTGIDGADRAQAIDTSLYVKQYTAEIKTDIKPLILDQEQFGVLGKASQFALAATQLAIEDAGLSREVLFGERINCYFGTTDGESDLVDSAAQSILAQQLECISKPVFDAMLPSQISRNVLQYIRSTGEAMTIGNACSASNAAICAGVDAILLDDCDMAFCGGSDSLCRKTFAGFHRLGALNEFKSTPFDAERRGIIPGEGASVLVLERLSSALARGATIYAEVLGSAMNCDAVHMSNPNVDGISACLESALHNANVSKQNVDYICAHGTGTKANDSTEYNVISKVFPPLYHCVAQSKACWGILWVPRPDLVPWPVFWL